MRKLLLLLGTGLGSGYTPVASGTFGSMLGAAIYWYFFPSNNRLCLLITVVAVVIAVYVCGRCEECFDKIDDGRIVLDEVVGMWVSLLFLPRTLHVLFTAFIFFRFFDIYKPYIIRQSQKLNAGYGIVIDDVLAGISANLVVHVFLFFMKK